MIYPILNQGNNISPTLYSIMQSMVNYDSENKTKIRDLWSTARTSIFDFSYPLTSNIDKADFEHNILNHYLTRRINYDTVTLFKIMLENKLNEVMPKYNMLWDSLIDWNIFKAGTTTRQYSDSTTGSTTSNTTTSGTSDNNTTSNTTNSGKSDTNSTSNTTTSGKTATDTNNNETISGENSKTSTNSSSANSSLETSATTKKGTSDMPQNRISEVEDNSYLTEYTHGSDNTTSTGSSSDSGSSSEDIKNKETKSNTIDSDTTTSGTSDNNTTSNTTTSGKTDNNTTSNTTTSGKTDNNTTSKDDKIIKETVSRTADNTLELLIKYQTEYNNIWTLLYKDLDCLFYGLV